MKLAILANGPSLKEHDLSQITTDTMGLNRSWKLHENPTYATCLETVHYDAAPDYFERLAATGRLFVAGGGWTCGKKLRFGTGAFSRDVFKDGVVCELNGVGSVFYASLQVAYSLGYRTIFALGLDLYGCHFDGSPASPNVERQNAMFVNIPEDMAVYSCGSPASRAIFPKVSFDVLAKNS